MSAALAVDVVLVRVEPRRASDETRAAAQREIARRLDVTPSTVAIDRDPAGRPVVDGVALSLAHSGAVGAIAIADPGARLGVDVELVRPRRHLDRIARRIFEAHELPAWSALDEPARLLGFLRRWTEVEAVLKAQGTGIAGGFARAVPWPNGWSCAPIDAGPGFVASVAADAPEIALRLHRS